jgi:large subunit ribosomal protein L29
MTPKDLRQRSPEELRALLEELRSKFNEMKIELSQGKVKNTAMLRSVRKDIARVLTVMREKVEI